MHENDDLIYDKFHIDK